jgi:chemotaxis response regulator CheB
MRIHRAVVGVPGEAIRLGAAAHVLPPEGITAMLTALVREGNGGNQ